MIFGNVDTVDVLQKQLNSKWPEDKIFENLGIEIRIKFVKNNYKN